MAVITQLQPKTFLDSVLAAFMESAGKKSITLAVDVRPEIPGVFYCDKARLTQILNTLLEQAITRTEKGSIVIRTKKVDCPVDSHGKQFIHFDVEDTGSGLNLDCAEQILDTDIPVASWPKDFCVGDSAIALRMASKLVQLLGGKLQVEHAAAGSGNRFFFTIAVKPGQNSENASSQPTQTPVTAVAENSSSQVPSGVRVLVVDDVLENRMLVEVLLRKMGHRVSLAPDGKQAVESCQKEKYDAILMDIQMPELNGLDAVRQIRSGTLNAQSTIIAMSASTDKSDELAAIEAGCDDCLPKPLDRVRLERKIVRVAARVKQVQDAEQGRLIVSFLEGDCQYQKAVESFIETLPGRVSEIKDAFEKGDVKELGFKVHLLKGVGGFAGFPVFTEKAKQIEQTLKTSGIDKLHQQVEELVDLCLRTKRN